MFDMDFSEPYTRKIIGDISNGSASVSLMPNFVSRSIDELNTFAK